jgi:hypothetical protein
MESAFADREGAFPSGRSDGEAGRVRGSRSENNTMMRERERTAINEKTPTSGGEWGAGTTASRKPERPSLEGF